MEQKQVSVKLSLFKKTVVELNQEDSNRVVGGQAPTKSEISCAPPFTKGGICWSQLVASPDGCV